jgi:hypothetical protein
MGYIKAFFRMLLPSETMNYELEISPCAMPGRRSESEIARVQRRRNPLNRRTCLTVGIEIVHATYPPAFGGDSARDNTP